MNITDTRKDFPLLNPQPGEKKIIYLDSACQSLRPRQVTDAVTNYYLHNGACGGRSMHQLSTAVTRQCDETRAEIARFIGAARKEEIIFTRNTTEGINLFANSFNFHTGDVVLITGKEHNSNLIPWQMLVKKVGIRLQILPSAPDGTFDFAAFEKAFSQPVRVVSFGASSNLDGVVLPAEPIIKLAHKHGAVVLLDAAQSAPHYKINVRALDVDFLAFSGHKLLGPSGTGILYGKYKLLEALSPFMVGGDTVANSTYESCEFLPLPERFEAGLQDYAGIIGLGEAVRYLQKVGLDAVQKQEHLLNEQITAETKEIPGLHVIGPADPALRGGIFTFYIDNIDSHRIALMLDQMANICVRSGMHCVHSWFNEHHIKGSVRASFYFYNSPEEITLFAENLKKIRKVL